MADEFIKAAAAGYQNGRSAAMGYPQTGLGALGRGHSSEGGNSANYGGWMAMGSFVAGFEVKDGKFRSLDPSECPPDVRARLVENGSLRLDKAQINILGDAFDRDKSLDLRHKIALQLIHFSDWIGGLLRKFVQHGLKRQLQG